MNFVDRKSMNGVLQSKNEKCCDRSWNGKVSMVGKISFMKNDVHARWIAWCVACHRVLMRKLENDVQLDRSALSKAIRGKTLIKEVVNRCNGSLIDCLVDWKWNDAKKKKWSEMILDKHFSTSLCITSVAFAPYTPSSPLVVTIPFKYKNLYRYGCTKSIKWTVIAKE